MNLAVNSRDAMVKGGQLRIMTSRRTLMRLMWSTIPMRGRGERFA